MARYEINRTPSEQTIAKAALLLALTAPTAFSVFLCPSAQEPAAGGGWGPLVRVTNPAVKAPDGFVEVWPAQRMPDGDALALVIDLVPYREGDPALIGRLDEPALACAGVAFLVGVSAFAEGRSLTVRIRGAGIGADGLLCDHDDPAVAVVPLEADVAAAADALDWVRLPTLRELLSRSAP